MSKYQEALSLIASKIVKSGIYQEQNVSTSLDTLQELVDKATPLKWKRTVTIDTVHYDCPCCNEGYACHLKNDFASPYCADCGHRLE